MPHQTFALPTVEPWRVHRTGFKDACCAIQCRYTPRIMWTLVVKGASMRRSGSTQRARPSHARSNASIHHNTPLHSSVLDVSFAVLLYPHRTAVYYGDRRGFMLASSRRGGRKYSQLCVCERSRGRSPCLLYMEFQCFPSMSGSSAFFVVYERCTGASVGGVCAVRIVYFVVERSSQACRCSRWSWDGLVRKACSFTP